MRTDSARHERHPNLRRRIRPCRFFLLERNPRSAHAHREMRMQGFLYADNYEQNMRHTASSPSSINDPSVFRLLIAMFQLTVTLLLLSAAGILASPSRHDRVWPISGSKTVDLPQSSPFGPRIKISADSRYIGIDVISHLALVSWYNII